MSQVCVLGIKYQCEKTLIASAFDNFRVQHGISDKFDEGLFFRTLYDRFHGVHSKRIRADDDSRIYVLAGITLRELESVRPVRPV